MSGQGVSNRALMIMYLVLAGFYACYCTVLGGVSARVLRNYYGRKNVKKMAGYLAVVASCFVLETVYLLLLAVTQNSHRFYIIDPIVRLVLHAAFLFFIYVLLTSDNTLFLRFKLEFRSKVLNRLLICVGVLEALYSVIDILSVYHVRRLWMTDSIMPFIYSIYMIIVMTYIRTRKQHDPEKYARHGMAYLTIQMYFAFVLIVSISFSLIVLTCNLANNSITMMLFVLDLCHDAMPLVCLKFIFDTLTQVRNPILNDSDVSNGLAINSPSIQPPSFYGPNNYL